MKRLRYFLPLFLAVFATLAIMSGLASEDTLEIFGNANMDDTINADDVTYLHGIINKTSMETELADANYDGKIDQQDVSVVGEIIQGVETKLVLFDSAGKVVQIKTPVKSIIPVNRNAAEALRTIKTSDKIVAVSDSALNDKSYFPEFQMISSVGSAKTPDMEKILKQNPDLVIYYGTQWTGDYETINDTLKKANPDISVIGLDCFKPETYVQDIMKLGYIMGRVKEAEEFTDWYNDKIDEIENAIKDIADEAKPRVYEGGRSDFYQTGGMGSSSNNVTVMAGGKNIFADTTGDATVDPESLIKRDPQFIIWKISNIGGYSLEKDNTTKFKEKQDEVMGRPELSNVSAVKNGNVYIQSADVFFGGRYFLSIIYLSTWLHPDLFTDLDPEAIHQEYLTRFQGLDYDLSTQGVFVYPERT
ncbi:MAG: ABC transporter substrate-binding protein [Methanothrix sp.]|nr:ABC transporter substrate-binding protein [Methanothrix sp.]MDD4448456.1 ABC transporter substrate-binding protein [Methanothrix sp.]